MSYKLLDLLGSDAPHGGADYSAEDFQRLIGEIDVLSSEHNSAVTSLEEVSRLISKDSMLLNKQEMVTTAVVAYSFEATANAVSRAGVNYMSNIGFEEAVTSPAKALKLSLEEKKNIFVKIWEKIKEIAMKIWNKLKQFAKWVKSFFVKEKETAEENVKAAKETKGAVEVKDEEGAKAIEEADAKAAILSGKDGSKNKLEAAKWLSKSAVALNNGFGVLKNNIKKLVDGKPLSKDDQLKVYADNIALTKKTTNLGDSPEAKALRNGDGYLVGLKSATEASAVLFEFDGETLKTKKVSFVVSDKTAKKIATNFPPAEIVGRAQDTLDAVNELNGTFNTVLDKIVKDIPAEIQHLEKELEKIDIEEGEHKLVLAQQIKSIITQLQAKISESSEIAQTAAKFTKGNNKAVSSLVK